MKVVALTEQVVAAVVLLQSEVQSVCFVSVKTK